MEEGGGGNGKQKDINKIEREGSDVVCNTGLPLWFGDGGTVRQQQRLRVCENNWVRRIVKVKRVNRMRMDELREKIGVQMSLIGTLVKCRLI